MVSSAVSFAVTKNDLCEAIRTYEEKFSDAALSFVKNCKYWALDTLATSQCITFTVIITAVFSFSTC